MGGSGRERDTADLRIAGNRAAGIALGAKVEAILRAISGADGRPIDGVKRQALPFVGCGILSHPCPSGLLEQPQQRLVSQPLAGLRDPALADTGVGIVR